MAFDIKAAQALMLNEEFNRKVDNVIAAKSQGKKSVASQFSIPATMMQAYSPLICIKMPTGNTGCASGTSIPHVTVIRRQVCK